MMKKIQQCIYFLITAYQLMAKLQLNMAVMIFFSMVNLKKFSLCNVIQQIKKSDLMFDTCELYFKK